MPSSSQQCFSTAPAIATSSTRVMEGEPPIVALKTKTLEQCPLVNAVPREIPSDDHHANGAVEVEVREAKKHVRTGKLALESKLQLKLAEDDVALAWLPRHQADQVNRYEIGDDGKTPDAHRQEVEKTCHRVW